MYKRQVPIEDNIKGDEELNKIISHAMIVGDQRKHLAVILTLKTELNKKNQPIDILHPDVQKWLQKHGSDAQTASDLLDGDNKYVKIAIMNRIKKVNQKAISNASKVHNFMIAPREFSLAGNELTPAMKLKRHIVVNIYEKEINKMYECRGCHPG